MVKERAEGLQLYCKKYESIIINKKIISPILTGDKLLEAVVEGCREQSKLAAYLLNLNPEVIENILKCIYFSKSGKWNFETGLSNIQDKIIDITQYSLNYLKDVLRDNENFCNRVIVLEEIYKKLS